MTHDCWQLRNRLTATALKSMKRAGLCVILLLTAMRSPVKLTPTRSESLITLTPLHSPSLPRVSAAVAAAQLTANSQVRQALDWLQDNLNWINDEQARITAIPAPPFREQERATALKMALSSAGLRAQIDSAGNVIGELRGSVDNVVVVLSAHLDTVFPAGTEIRVRRENNRIYAPGISDNGTGLAALVAVARALQAARLKPEKTILFVANVGEEGEGNLRGMRALVNDYRERLKAVLVLDGAGTDHASTMALASRRIEVVVTGPGGHSWSDFGIPNPINA